MRPMMRNDNERMKYSRLILEFLTMMLSMHEIPPPMREREILLHSPALGHLVHRRKRERHSSTKMILSRAVVR